MKRSLDNIFMEDAISIGSIANLLNEHASSVRSGAHSLFLGQVRADEEGEKVVTAIEFSAYQEMANEQVALIRAQTLSKFRVSSLQILHSLGLVNVGEICLMVFVSGPHRREAIDACHEVVERVKAELPIWGCEWYNDHSHHWKVNR